MFRVRLAFDWRLVFTANFKWTNYRPRAAALATLYGHGASYGQRRQASRARPVSHGAAPGADACPDPLQWIASTLAIGRKWSILVRFFPLLADRFVPGAIATLTVSIRLPQSTMRGRWQGRAEIDPERGLINVIVEAHGFEVISEPPAPLDVPADRDTAPVAFELRIVDTSERWLHVLVTQEGSPIGELAINDFSAIGTGPVQNVAHSPIRMLREADLTLIMRMREDRIEAYSPRDRACLSGVPIKGFQYPTEPFREILRSRLKALYDEKVNAKTTERELQLVGKELAKSRPVDLRNLLQRADIRSVMLRHQEDFEFPIELCYLDDGPVPFFVGDRIAICRWYMGVTNPPDVVRKSIGRVAFLQGSDDSSPIDRDLLNRLFPGRVAVFERHGDIVSHLFKTSDFDLIHFTGHCRVNEEGEGGLELADESFLCITEVGQLEAERAFTRAHPFVMVNACASSRPYVALTNRDSFPHRFVTSEACAFVGTMWPVSGPVANEFAEHFYFELMRKPVGRALLAAKEALIRQDEGQGSEEVSPEHKLARRISARSYCLFANPDFCLGA